jgi:hypothetical protein
MLLSSSGLSVQLPGRRRWLPVRLAPLQLVWYVMQALLMQVDRPQ